jgi:hypothetical protein
MLKGFDVMQMNAVLGGLVVIVLTIRPKVCGFIPGRGRWIFKGGEIS